MSKSRVAAAATRALPYKYGPTSLIPQGHTDNIRPLPPKLPPPTPVHRPRRRILPYLVGACAVYVFTAYGIYSYNALSAEPSSLPQDTDVSSIYNTTAPDFDRDVTGVESVTGLLRARKLLTKKAHGHILEVSAGTGRNSKYYKLEKCASITLVDLSPEMMDICRQKWQLLHPEYASVDFHTQSALLPLPKAPPNNGYTTILQTFGLCSTPEPTQLLRHLGTLLDKDEGKILLLEHGRGWFSWVNWVLDRTAGKHAERHGCWWNRDLEKVVGESGLVVIRSKRKHLGTTWIFELRAPKPGEEVGAKKYVLALKGEKSEEDGLC